MFENKAIRLPDPEGAFFPRLKKIENNLEFPINIFFQ
jgi:hypothetical protein